MFKREGMVTDEHMQVGKQEVVFFMPLKVQHPWSNWEGPELVYPVNIDAGLRRRLNAAFREETVGEISFHFPGTVNTDSPPVSHSA